MTKRRIRVTLVGLLLTALVVGIGACVVMLVVMPEIRARKKRQSWILCHSNLRLFDLALGAYCYPPVNTYPATLDDLNTNVVVPEVYFCPGGPGMPTNVTMANVGLFCDYIYVSGLSPGTPAGQAVIICPPLNHDGKGGYVLGSDHAVRWVPSPQIDKLISDLYSDTNLTIIVSPALTKRSKGRYRSRDTP
jgi:hypothetical protein